MSEHVDEQLEDFVLGTLPPAERAIVAQHLATCETCQALLQSFDVAMKGLSLAIAAPPPMRKRLEQALSGGARFAHFQAQLEQLFDLPANDVEQILKRVDDPAAWDEGLAPGVKVMTVQAGAAREGFMTALVYLDPGATFPEHGHGAQEEVLVLEGGYRDSSGVEIWRGELDVRHPGNVHSFTAFADAPCLCASVSKPPED